MIMKKHPSFLLLTPIVLCSCGGTSSANSSSLSSSASSSSLSSSSRVSWSEESYATGLADGQYTFDFRSRLLMDEDGSPYQLHYTIPYQEDFFLLDGRQFHQELALLSASYAISANSKKQTEEFFVTLGFDHIFHSPDYDAAESADTIRYSFAHKNIDGHDLVAVMMDAQAYFKPWANNVVIGKEGNAVGFQIAADRVLPYLEEYLEKYAQNNVKIWITGYSRSAAIADILAQSLLERDIVREENLFHYGFEAPAVIDVNHFQPHPSIHNICVGTSLLSSFYPECFGLTHGGNVIDIYDERASDIVADFDPRVTLPEFIPDSGYYDNDAEYLDLILSSLTVKVDVENEGYVPDMHDRSSYVDNNYESYLSYVIGKAMSLSLAARAELLESFQENAVKLITLNGLYHLLKTALDKNGIPYDDEYLKTATNSLVRFLTTDVPITMYLVSSKVGKSNFARALAMHAPEVFFPLLLNYFPK